MRLKALVSIALAVLIYIFPPLLYADTEAFIKLEEKYLIQHWLSSREEETVSNETKIFRPKSYKVFPASRFRQGYIFHADGNLQWLYLSPVDAHHYKPGKWRFDSEKENIIHFDLEGRTESWEIKELTKQLLRISRI